MLYSCFDTASILRALPLRVPQLQRLQLLAPQLQTEQGLQLPPLRLKPQQGQHLILEIAMPILQFVDPTTHAQMACAAHNGVTVEQPRLIAEIAARTVLAGMILVPPPPRQRR